MNVNSIDKFSESSSSLERLKHRGQSVRDRHIAAESGVGLRDNYEDKSGRVMNENNSAAFNFKGIEKLLAKDWVGKLLAYGGGHHQTANALVGFIMGGILRPTATMQLNLDEKKDKVLATFHSICSAVLGLTVTMVITQPIDNAVNKLKDPKWYNEAGRGLKNSFADIDKQIAAYLEKGLASNSKEIKHLQNKKALLELIAKNAPEWAICVPRAILTIALIPIFMKGITSLHSKLANKPKNAPVPDKKSNDTVKTAENKIKEKGNVEVANNKKQDVNFKGLSDVIAKKIVTPFVNSRRVLNLADKYADNKDFVYDMIQMVASFAISTTYAVRSYKSKSLDDDAKNRKILALNHFTTWAISTAISLLTLKRLGNWWQRHIMAKLIVTRAEFASEAAKNNFVREYAEKQAEKIKIAKNTKGFFERYKAKNDASKYSALNYYIDTNPNVNLSQDKYKEFNNMLSGGQLSQRQLVWGTVTRFLVPLCSTVIASKVGRKVINKREAKLEANRQAEQQQMQQMAEDNKKLEKLVKDIEIEESVEV